MSGGLSADLTDLNPEDQGVQDQKIQSLKELRCQGRDLVLGQEVFQLFQSIDV